MCSQDYEDITNDLTETDRTTSYVKIGNPCKRCNEKADIVLRKRDLLCRNCFLSYVTHKFRATIGKSKLIKLGDRVLVAFSGSQASVALLHLILEGQKETARKKVLYEPLLVYIIEPLYTANENSLHQIQHSKILSLMKASSLTSYAIHMEQIMLDELSQNSLQSVNENDKITNTHDECLQRKLCKLIQSTKSLTSKEDVVHRLRLKLLVSCARQLECNKIFVADSGTKLAVHLMSGIAEGRGGQISSEMGFVDDRHDGVVIVRPMRELISKEIAIYNRVHGLMYESNVKMCTMTGMHSSISRLTESFIIGLQQDFPSTISTIFRTGDKLVRKSDEESSKCIFCESSIEILTPGKCSAMDALELSSKLGQTDELSVNNFVKSEKNIKCDSCQCGADKHTESNVVKNQLCYACRLLVNEMDDLDLLPSSILKQANLQANRLKMKESIAEFLINDG